MPGHLNDRELSLLGHTAHLTICEAVGHQEQPSEEQLTLQDSFMPAQSACKFAHYSELFLGDVCAEDWVGLASPQAKVPRSS